MTQSELLDKINKQYEFIGGVNADEMTDLEKYCALTGIVDASVVSEDGKNFNDDLSEDVVGHLAWLMPGGAGRDVVEESEESVQPEEKVEPVPTAEELSGISEVEPLIK